MVRIRLRRISVRAANLLSLFRYFRCGLLIFTLAYVVLWFGARVSDSFAGWISPIACTEPTLTFRMDGTAGEKIYDRHGSYTPMSTSTVCVDRHDPSLRGPVRLWFRFEGIMIHFLLVLANGAAAIVESNLLSNAEDRQKVLNKEVQKKAELWDGSK